MVGLRRKSGWVPQEPAGLAAISRCRRAFPPFSARGPAPCAEADWPAIPPPDAPTGLACGPAAAAIPASGWSCFPHSGRDPHGARAALRQAAKAERESRLLFLAAATRLPDLPPRPRIFAPALSGGAILRK